MTPRDVIVAVATPPGRGAIGIVRLSGRGALKAALSFLKPEQALVPRRQTLSWAHDGEERLDQVLATLFPEGKSYTGEEMVEIAAHGSAYILERLIELSQASGARLAQAGEFTTRAFLNGRLDLTQAEAVCDLIHARTRQSHRAALSQLEGGLRSRVDAARAELMDLTALAEANIDHPDEDLPPLPREDAQRRLCALEEIVESLRAGYRRGRLANEGARVALVGRTNAGKSSLLNALLGSDRAIVSDKPGTTRDAVSETADLEGLEAVLVDTAGLREDPSDPVEREGQARALQALRACDLGVFVVDSTAEPQHARSLMARLRAETEVPPIIVALNKSDLNPRRCRRQHLPESEVVEVSAIRGDGLPDLAAALRRHLAGQESNASAAINARHARALEEAARELAEAKGRIQSDEYGELTAHHLRRALDALGRITGKVTSEDVLGEIFSRFCIGK